MGEVNGYYTYIAIFSEDISLMICHLNDGGKVRNTKANKINTDDLAKLKLQELKN